MSIKSIKKSSTGNERQARRRERERQWLTENGWRSWEALHTALMKGAVHLYPNSVDISNSIDNLRLSRAKASK